MTDETGYCPVDGTELVERGDAAYCWTCRVDFDPETLEPLGRADERP